MNILRLPINDHAWLCFPLLEPQAVGLNVSPEALAAHFTASFQKEVLDKGEFLDTFKYFARLGAIGKNTVAVPLPHGKNRKNTQITLYFEYFHFLSEAKGHVLALPALGIEAYAETPETLDEVAREAVKLEFMRSQRLKDVSELISVLWFGSAELLTVETKMHFPTPAKVASIAEEGKQTPLLPTAAQLLPPKGPQKLYRMEGPFKELLNALKNRFTRSVLLVGKSGVGKTTMVMELARVSAQHGLAIEIWETTASALIKALTGDGGWQENLHRLCKELTAGKIIHVRNLLELFEVGQYEGNSVSMADYLREYISRGEISLLAEATEEEFAIIEARSPHFVQLFQIIRLEEPTAELEEIILKKVRALASTRSVDIDNEAIRECLRLNRRYLPYSGFPGKPIRFLEGLLLDRRAGGKLDRNAILQAFCEETGMPMFMVDPETPFDPLSTEAFLLKNVFGQPRAVRSLVDILAAVKTGLVRTGKPIASLFFVGPTGVGKTEMAKVLAELMFGSRDRLLRFDMSEYADPAAVVRLTTGFGEGSEGVLSAAVRREPFCVLLFDELEKAHPLFYDMLLQVLGEGRLTDSQGKLIDFCSTIIIMTSNIGAQKMEQSPIALGQGARPSPSEFFLQAAQQFFRPELFNRIDRVLAFDPLDRATIRFVVDRELSLFLKREGIVGRKLNIQIDDAVPDLLAQLGYHPRYGAREMQRALNEHLVVPLSKQLNEFGSDEQLNATISVENGVLQVNIASDPLQLDILVEELSRTAFSAYAGELRYSFLRLMEGQAHMMVASKLAEMERDKKKNTKAFWGDALRSKDYPVFVQVMRRLADLGGEIESLEQAIALGMMGLRTYEKIWEENLREWDENCFGAKLELLNCYAEESNAACDIRIVSAQPQAQVDFYREVLAHLGEVTVVLSSIWYSETLSQQLGAKPKGDPLYWAQVEVWPAPTYAPPDADPDAVLVGALISVQGEQHPFLFFSGETGIHHWKFSDDRQVLCHVLVERDNRLFPPNAYRKQYFKGLPQPRRVYEPSVISDTQFQLQKRLITKMGHAEELFPKLKGAFRLKVEGALL